MKPWMWFVGAILGGVVAGIVFYLLAIRRDKKHELPVDAGDVIRDETQAKIESVKQEIAAASNDALAKLANDLLKKRAKQ